MVFIIFHLIKFFGHYFSKLDYYSSLIYFIFAVYTIHEMTR